MHFEMAISSYNGNKIPRLKSQEAATLLYARKPCSQENTEYRFLFL